MTKSKLTNNFIIGTFITLYVVVSLISTIHVIDFFKLSNPDWLAVSLAIAFEIGAAASLAALIALKKMSKWMVWGVFLILAGMQMMGNTYYAYTHLHDFQGWSELFGLIEEDIIYQKRMLSIISGAILPLIALGFIKSLVDYIRPEEFKNESIPKKVVEQIVEPKAKPIKEAVEPAKLFAEDLLIEEPLDENSVLTKEDIEYYHEKTKRANVDPIDPTVALNPQVMPGVN